MSADADLPAHERETLELVGSLMATGNLRPLIERLRAGETGPERVRDALKTLGELDPDLLAQLALDTLIDQYVGEPGTALQPRRRTWGARDLPAG